MNNLYHPFADSSYGLELEQRTRFNDFKPDFVGTEMWTRLLGNDVNNLYHMPHTYEIAKTFCLEGGLSEHSTDVLLTTAITHDWGEAVIGDIPLPDKSDADETREEWAYRSIARELFGAEGDELSETVWKVLSHTDKTHGDMFRSIEYVGYCTTAMRAGRVATCLANGFTRLDIGRADTQRLVGGLLSLEKAVSVVNFPTLNEYRTKYPFIEKVVESV